MYFAFRNTGSDRGTAKEEVEIINASDPFLYVNGIRYEIPRDCDPERSLNSFLRDTLQLTGTKVMCNEGGCGCCIVNATFKHPGTEEISSVPVNSCLTPVYSTIGWHVLTVEGLGGVGKSHPGGYHPIQRRLADGYGSQCGFCSPGFVMSAYSQLRENPRPTEAQVEHFFDGNICRCTGYRPILDAMKSFACDGNSGAAGCLDIEDLNPSCCKGLPVQKIPSAGLAPVARGWRNQKFFSPGGMSDLLTLVTRYRSDRYRLVFGNTSAGVFKEDAVAAEHYINVRNVPELHYVKETDASLEIGANATIHELCELFHRVSASRPQFRHLEQVSRHLQVVANQAVRRNACWAGNLMMKHAHPEFPSDLFVLFEAVKAVVMVTDAGGAQEYILTDFMRQDMSGRVISAIRLPGFATEAHRFGSFKVTPRALNAHAYVNAAFNARVDESDGFRVTERPSIVYGGISHKFNHAVKTENYLLNKKLLDEQTVEGAVAMLESEMSPDEQPTWSSPANRRNLASNLLYKFILGAIGDESLATEYSSGGRVLERPVQSAQQDFEEVLQPAPLGKAMPKQEARAQAAGEAKFTNDMPPHINELFAAFVQAPEAPAELKGLETDEAEGVPGYVRMLTAKDLEGGYVNDVVTQLLPASFAQKEEILCSGEIRYAGQPLALVLATSQWAADCAASLVTVNFVQTGEPITSVAEAVAKSAIILEKPQEFVGEGGAEALTVGLEGGCQVEGQIVVNEQAHFFLESLTASAVPNEEGLVITAPHQWSDELVAILTRVLGRPASQLRIVTPRIGGGFGGKLFMMDLVAAACAVAADVTSRPVRMLVPLGKYMAMAMKRPGWLLGYRASANPATGKLRAISLEVNQEAGYALNLQLVIADEFKENMDQAYNCPNYGIRTRYLRTDKPESTFMRGPGPSPAAVVNLLMMDHLAFQLGADPIQFKRDNLYKDGDTNIFGGKRVSDNYQRMWQELYEAADIKTRLAEIETFNKANKYRKRGLDMGPSSQYIGFERGRPSQVYLAVQYCDGTITLSHSGVEMGQGLGLKSAQAVASVLGIDLAKIKLKPTDTHVIPNNDITGGSATSEWNCQAAVDAANQLVAKMRPLREANPDDTWEALVAKAGPAGISLAAMGSFMRTDKDPNKGKYHTTGMAAIEAEVDILTGQYQIRRADLMMDLGKSLNPGVDVGQVEGGFVMGMGYYLMERTVYDADNGRNLTDGTWEYKVPLAADTPRDFRVHLLKQSSNPLGVLGTKAIGEPAVCLASLCVTAVKRAIEAFRAAQGKPRRWLSFDLPLTPERVLQLCEVAREDRRFCDK